MNIFQTIIFAIGFMPLPFQILVGVAFGDYFGNLAYRHLDSMLFESLLVFSQRGRKVYQREQFFVTVSLCLDSVVLGIRVQSRQADVDTILREQRLVLFDAELGNVKHRNLELVRVLDAYPVPVYLAVLRLCGFPCGLQYELKLVLEFFDCVFEAGVYVAHKVLYRYRVFGVVYELGEVYIGVEQYLIRRRVP